jgi:hypothetical protein
MKRSFREHSIQTVKHPVPHQIVYYTIRFDPPSDIAFSYKSPSLIMKYTVILAVLSAVIISKPSVVNIQRVG